MEGTGNWRTFHNEDIHDFSFFQNILGQQIKDNFMAVMDNVRSRFGCGLDPSGLELGPVLLPR